MTEDKIPLAPPLAKGEHELLRKKGTGNFFFLGRNEG